MSKEVDETVAQPASLLYENHENLFGKKAVMTGWEIPNEKIKEVSRYLQKADVKIISHLDCDTVVRKIKIANKVVSRRFLCSKTDPYTLLTCVSIFIS